MSRNEATDNTVSSLNDVYASIDVLVDYAGKHLNLDPRDADWTRNRIFELFELDSVLYSIIVSGQWFSNPLRVGRSLGLDGLEILLGLISW